MQYSSTSKRSLPLNRTPTSRSKTAATWCALRGSTERWSGSGGGCGVSVMGWRGLASAVQSCEVTAQDAGSAFEHLELAIRQGVAHHVEVTDGSPQVAEVVRQRDAVVGHHPCLARVPVQAGGTTRGLCAGRS